MSDITKDQFWKIMEYGYILKLNNIRIDRNFDETPVKIIVVMDVNPRNLHKYTNDIIFVFSYDVCENTNPEQYYINLCESLFYEYIDKFRQSVNMHACINLNKNHEIINVYLS